jgi:hypothetical protein
LVTVAAVAAA